MRIYCTSNFISLYTLKSLYINSPVFNLFSTNFTTGNSAWSPEESTYNQFLTIDLGYRHEIRSIATRGLSMTKEYVTEYIIQFSDDGEGWRSYTYGQGETEVV